MSEEVSIAKFRAVLIALKDMAVGMGIAVGLIWLVFSNLVALRVALRAFLF